MTDLAVTPPLSSACLSDLALDALVSDDAVADVTQREHLASCARCAERRALFSESTAIARPRITRLAAAARERARTTPPWWRRAPTLACVGLAVAATLTLVVVRSERGELVADEVRIKGTTMKWFVQRDQQSALAASGDRFRAGDALRFTISAARAQHFMLVGLDARGARVDVYYPRGATTSAMWPAGVDTPLPYSLVLDAAPGPEYFVSLFATSPFDVDQLRRELAAATAAGLAPPAAIDRLLPGATRLVFVVEKE